MSYRCSQKRKQKLIRLEAKTRNSYGAGAFYDDKKNRIIRYSVHSRWLKHHCRKEMRRRLKDIDYNFHKKCDYKKLYDYWWSLL